MLLKGDFGDQTVSCKHGDGINITLALILVFRLSDANTAANTLSEVALMIWLSDTRTAII